MILSRYRNFIFIHVYKNAGTSISNALNPFVLSPTAARIRKMLQKANISLRYLDPHPFSPHTRAWEMIDAMGLERFKSYFSFAIVRNPWDWQVSLYKYALKLDSHHQHELVRKLGSFDEYVRWRCDNEVRYQKDFICSREGDVVVDFVGRYENLDADFKKICSHIGVDTLLPRMNVSNTRSYKEYYTDHTRELVRQTFKPDIELLGYDF